MQGAEKQHTAEKQSIASFIERTRSDIREGETNQWAPGCYPAKAYSHSHCFHSLGDWYKVKHPLWPEGNTLDEKEDSLWLDKVENGLGFAPVYGEQGQRVYHKALLVTLSLRGQGEYTYDYDE